ncbi:MAG TPA: hypothetical protein VNF73_09600 [Candidatus Saccharimonadales bacterium]|nr:hypothetical protein [Candidatus Saccharimonadales bacterium]
MKIHLAFVLVLAMAACGAPTASAPIGSNAAVGSLASPITASSGESSPGAATSQTPPSPDPVALKAAAAKSYLAIATSYNKTIDLLNKGCGNEYLSLAGARACSAKYAVAEHVFYVAVNALTVPVEAASDQRALVHASSAVYIDERLEATAPTIAAWDADNQVSSKASTASSIAANNFRLDLGLPPVPIT